MHRRAVPAALSALTLAACVAGPSGSGPSPAERSSTSHVVISVAGMQAPPRLITLMEMRVRNMDVKESGGACPEIEFRGRNSITAPTPPTVYVDGQRASNTCVLDLISPLDVSTLEVYPMGVSNRPGYLSTVGGLILVFTKDGRG